MMEDNVRRGIEYIKHFVQEVNHGREPSNDIG
jgi:hypothetical protein